MQATSQKNRRQKKSLLNKARWAGYAAAGAATVLGVDKAANAEVVRESFNPQITLDGTTGSNPDNYFFDVNQDGTDDFKITHVHWVSSYSGFVPSNGLAYLYGLNGSIVGAGSTALLLRGSNQVDRGQGFISWAALALSSSGSFTSSGPGQYVGFSFNADDGTHYGWLQVDMGGAPLNKFNLVDYAYESVAGVGIHVPEPGSLGLLATGAVGLLLWRRAARQEADSLRRMSGKPKVLVIGWDAADWEHINPLLEAGLMPHLDRLINAGVMGNLATLQPILSPMLWNSVATGKLPAQHGIHGFIEPDPVHGGVRPYTSTSRKVKALWNILTQVGLKSNIVGWWASHPAEPIDGCIVTNRFTGIRFVPQKGWQVAPGTIHPADKAAFLAQFRVLPHELTHEHIFPFIPHAERLDQQHDPLVTTFAKLLSDCASIHAVATAVMETEPWDLMAIYYDSIDHFCHAFMPFHPPRMPHVSQEQFELYKDVVAGAYRFHDLMLARLLELAPPDTTVILCSDHGFHSRQMRPKGLPREPAGPAVWHREYGIFVAQGPGIKRDERVYGASLIDVGPTVLYALGLPVGQDMDGRPLVEIWDAPRAVDTIPSWEAVPGRCGMHLPNTVLPKEDADELLQQFIALGYVEDPGEDKAKAAESAEIEARYNLSRSLLWANQADKALVLLEDICRRRPWETRFLNVLAQAYRAGGYMRQAERVLEATYPSGSTMPPALKILWGDIRGAQGDLPAALDLYEQAGREGHALPRLHVRLGETYLRLRRFADAETAFRKALEIHEDAAPAWQGLSTVYRRWGLNQETADAALNAVGLLHRMPEAHFNLGVALARSGDTARAIVALEMALKFRPTMIKSHRWLAVLRGHDPAQSAQATFHRLEVARLQLLHQQAQPAAQNRRDTLFDLPHIPPPHERLQILDRERPLPPAQRPPSGKCFVVVSGLPRSGTSLMMQILEAGGLSVVTDGRRAADPDNPRGYYEWEDLKQIAKRPELLDGEAMDKKAIKCLSMLLRSLPAHHRYKVLFMLRPIEEVVASQTCMLQRLETEGAQLDPHELMRGLTSHRDDTLRWLARAPHMEALEIDYPTLVQSPSDILPRIAAFLGPDLLPLPARMSSVIDPHLYRQQGSATQHEASDDEAHGPAGNAGKQPLS